MRPFKRSKYPKAMLIYISAILVLTVVLLSMGIGSIARERTRLESLSNIELLGQALSTELTGRAWESARACLTDPVIRLAVSEDGKSGVRADKVRPRQLEGYLRARHPIARHFFITRNGRLVYPESRSDQPSIASLIAESIAGPRFARFPVDNIGADTLRIADDFHQVFYTGMNSGSDNVIYGFSADASWVRDTLLPQSTDAALQDLVLPNLRIEGNESQWRTDELEIPLQKLFPFLQLTISPAHVAARIQQSKRNILYLVFANLLFLAVIAVGTILVGRVARELHLREMKGEFLSAFSHDLKTPLTIIQLYSETLLRNENLSKRSRATYYRIINRESQNLGQMLERVLTMNRYERGRAHYRLIEGDLLKDIGRKIRSYLQHLRLRGFHVVVSLPQQLPPVRFDVEAAGQAVLNLMDNARKYSGDAKYIGVALYQAGKEVVIEVQDRGPGIPKEEQTQLFDGFYRGKDAASRKGFGMGLYLVKQVMLAHRGRVELDSQVGKGTTVRLIFPVAAHREHSLAGIWAATTRLVNPTPRKHLGRNSPSISTNESQPQGAAAGPPGEPLTQQGLR
ncbi:MAG: sensor histidine kinase [Acidobacteriota bacterium]